MSTPHFILALRAKIGHDPLTLPGVTAVVFDEADRVLLVCRSDNGRWALVTGCLEPGEQPAIGAVREIEEETGVRAIVERLVSVDALALRECPNGDLVYWLDTTFRCRAVSSEAWVNDDESVDVGWFDPAGDDFPPLPPREMKCIEDARSSSAEAAFAM